MPFNIGLLSDAALTGLSDTEKESMQKQATQQFLLGSLLSGDPATGFKSAMDIPSTAITMQDMLRKSQQAQADQAALEGFRAKYTPTRFQEANPAYMGPVMPEQLAQQEQIKGARLQGLPFNIQNALQDVLALPTASQGSMRETISALQPKVQGDLLMNPNMQIIGSLPTQKDLIQSKLNPLTGMYEARPVVGGLESKVALNLPEVRPNQQLLIDPITRGFTTSVLPGGLSAEQQLNYNQKLGQGLAALQTTPTNVIDIPTGRQKRVTEAQALGMPTSLSASEVQAYEGYKPVREAAFKGYQAATSSDASLQNLQNIINRGAFEPGKFAGFKSEAAAIATGLGIGGDRAKAVAVDSPLFLQSVADVASANIQDLVGATSDKDIQFSATRGPQITNPKEAVQYYLDLTRVANQRKKDYYNYITNNPVPNVVEKWSTTPQGSSSIFEDPKLRKYLPKFPVNEGPDKGKTAYQLPNGNIVLFN
jgi:hypothetical protein